MEYWGAWTREQGEPCEVCGLPLFRRSRTGVGIGVGHLPECRALSKERHNGSPEVKASKTRYNGTPKAAGNRRRFKDSPKGKVSSVKYAASPGGRDSSRKYRASSGAKSTRKQWINRPGRICRYSDCFEFARVNGLECVQHHNGNMARHRSKLRRKLAERQHWVCTWCMESLPGDLSDTHIDHVIPVSHGGPDEMWNFDLLHGVCNLSKSDKITPRAIDLGYVNG